ncbi:MAG: PAS domain-containing protein [Deltaproteobacteria bacterium]|jgi:PAS domain S-box-containing protein|nr:PAS domain-containing protein [Deltaproteobacteria bacterium]MBW2542031.1 PAS domain-containing protein [Deltaproteobacteria bacterium]
MGTLNAIPGTGDAAFASNEKGAIVFWNDAANRLLGYSSGEVLGRSCFKVIGGFDIFGNPYCRSDCNLRRSLLCRNAICPFQLQVRKSSGEYILAALRIEPVSGRQLSDFQVVHRLKQILSPTDVAPRSYLNPAALDSQSEETPRHRESRAHSPESPLTNREREVLAMLASGSSTNRIAKKLHISVATVRNHVQSILRKLAVHSKLEAVFIAHRNHLV